MKRVIVGDGPKKMTAPIPERREGRLFPPEHNKLFGFFDVDVSKKVENLT